MSKKNRNKNPDSYVRNNYDHSEDYSGRTGFNKGRLSFILFSSVMVLAVLMTAGCTGNSAGGASDITVTGGGNGTADNSGGTTDNSEDSADSGINSEITDGSDGSGKITESEYVTENVTAVSGDELSGTDWLLTSYMGVNGGMNEVPEGIDATLTFVNESILGGNSGCNSYSADYKAKDGVFKTGIIVFTAMYCTDATMEFENDYLELLQKGSSAVMSDGKLVISDEEGGVLLNFLPFKISGSSWELISMNDGKEAVLSLPENIGITLEFSDDKASGNAGCNNYFSSYSTDEYFGIEFSAIGSTRMYCEEAVMVYESAYLKNLESVSRYYFNGKSLIFRDDDGKTLMTFVKSGKS
ncbi:META domain-containing protein [Methanoplanus endosymbiosus]|uniref:META domain-containing protein n=1 Tax=Methanoplanus endosymbiosus TaxID=33865 RepID=A0A9E7PLN0_9EURY|nr:META domain-containing protein [Methanoplanus endosymbiosus]UUX92438.1 META domain-containing protein [Methanoplanus endosymbiosus]